MHASNARRSWRDRIFLLLLAVIALVALGAVPARAVPDGDLTGDGQVTVLDAARALRFAAEFEQPGNTDLARGDIAPLGADRAPGGDGRIDIKDVLLLLRKAVGLPSGSALSQLPPPWDGTSLGIMEIRDLLRNQVP